MYLLEHETKLNNVINHRFLLTFKIPIAKMRCLNNFHFFSFGLNMDRRLRHLLNFLLLILILLLLKQIFKSLMQKKTTYTEYELALLRAQINPKRTLKSNSDHKTLVLYSYFEKNEHYANALRYFIELGVDNVDNIDYVFIVQGYRVTVDIPEYKNIKILKRKNDCYDFGAYGKVFKWLGGINSLRRYDFFVFINPSVLGPILPKYWPTNIHWTEVFISRLDEDVHACSTSIACLPKDDLGGWGPRIEGLKISCFFKLQNFIYYSGTSQAYFVNDFEHSHSQNITTHSHSFTVIHNHSQTFKNIH
jgi:hypothetical protein